jgi:hypothetical protein
MSEIRLPVSPICEREVLLPFPISQVSDYASGKPYGMWICEGCRDKFLLRVKF